VASLLNRLGASTAAGWVLVLVLVFAIIGAVAGSPKLDYIYLPAFDLLAIPVMVAALVLPLRWVWVVSVIGAALIAVDMFVQPRSTIPTSLASFVAQYGIYVLALRPIILVVVTAILVFLLASLLQQQVRRADRAEELAELERQQVEERQELQTGVAQLRDVHIRLANGDYNARATLNQDNQLFVVGQSLNNLVSRFQSAGRAEYEYRRIQEECRRLVVALDEARAGRHPLWPAPSGTSLDDVIDRLAGRRRPALQSGGWGPEQQSKTPPTRSRLAAAPFIPMGDEADSSPGVAPHSQRPGMVTDPLGFPQQQGRWIPLGFRWRSARAIFSAVPLSNW
jgi:hypothetical protein